MSAQPACVLLDRDGVLNQDRPDYVKSWEEWVWQEGVLAALARLKAAGVRVGVVTNQSCVGQGLVSSDTLEAIHARMRSEVAEAGGRIDGIFFCPHTDAAGCDCRKPMPGLLYQAAAYFGCTLADVPYVGDAGRDLLAAMTAGARPVLVRTGKGVATESGTVPPGTAVYDDLPAFVDALLGPAAQ